MTTYNLILTIPKCVKITNYRTMTKEKKGQAVNGNKNVQYEWMIEEVNEFYEAISLCDRDEVLDEALGLIRTAQQFSDSKRVMKKWNWVAPDVRKVFTSKKIFNETFKKWHKKKLKKGQAKGVKPHHLSDFAGLSF